MHLHMEYFSHLFSRELDELYISMAMRSFALSIVGIFVPIYLLEIGFSVNSVLIYFLIFAVTRLAFAAPAAKLAARYGLKKMMLASNILMAAYFILLRSAPHYGWDINPLAILAGIALTLFWISYHTNFVKISKRRYIGEEISAVIILTSVVSFLGPFVGGTSILIFGFDSVFAAAVIILAMAMVPLFLTKDRHQPFSLSARKIFSNNSLGDYLGHAGYGIEAYAHGIIWIMIIFLSITSNIASVGFILSIGLFASMIVSYFSGKYSDRKPNRILRIGVFATVLAWIIRLLVKNFFQLVASDLIYGSVRPARGVPYDTICYRKARGRIAENIVFRESIITLGLIALLLAVIAANDLVAGIYAAVAGALMLLPFRDRKQK